MTRYQQKNLLITLLGLALLLTTGVVWQHYRQLRAGEAQRVLLPAGAVSRIVTRRDGNTLVFQRLAGQWRLTEPVDAPARADRVDVLLALLIRPATPGYAIEDIDPAALGLEPPLATITIDTLEFRFGDLRRSTNTRYLQIQDRVYLVGDLVVPLISGGPAAFSQP